MNGETPAEFAALCLAPAFDETVAPGGAPGANEHPGGKGLNVARWLAARREDGSLVFARPLRLRAGDVLDARLRRSDALC